MSGWAIVGEVVFIVGGGWLGAAVMFRYVNGHWWHKP